MDSHKKKTEAKQDSAIDFSRSSDFVSRYANNAYFESSLWDLKIVFGQNDQSVGLNAVVQHTAMTVPWPQLKVLLYFISSHLLVHELQNGRIIIPTKVIPAVPDVLPPELSDNPHGLEVHAAIRQLYENFISANPEAAPIKAASDRQPV
jgi:hypothetical protein